MVIGHYSHALSRQSCCFGQGDQAGALVGGEEGDVLDGGVQGLDGVLEPEDVAEAVVQTIESESFLILPHPEVTTYMQRKTSDYDRWLGGMRRLQANWRERVGQGDSG